jgi:hypothetical protein
MTKQMKAKILKGLNPIKLDLANNKYLWVWHPSIGLNVIMDDQRMDFPYHIKLMEALGIEFKAGYWNPGSRLGIPINFDEIARGYIQEDASTGGGSPYIRAYGTNNVELGIFEVCYKYGFDYKAIPTWIEETVGY